MTKVTTHGLILIRILQEYARNTGNILAKHIEEVREVANKAIWEELDAMTIEGDLPERRDSRRVMYSFSTYFNHRDPAYDEPKHAPVRLSLLAAFVSLLMQELPPLHREQVRPVLNQLLAYELELSVPARLPA